MGCTTLKEVTWNLVPCLCLCTCLFSVGYKQPPEGPTKGEWDALMGDLNLEGFLDKLRDVLKWDENRSQAEEDAKMLWLRQMLEGYDLEGKGCVGCVGCN